MSQHCKNTAQPMCAGTNAIDLTVSSPITDANSCLLPAANPEAAVTTVDSKTAALLARYHLCLVHHPRILVCTRTDCIHGLPLVPFFKDVAMHLQRIHHHPLGDHSKKVLQAVLEELALEPPLTVPIFKELLPAPMVPELDIIYQGYSCNLCSYAVKAKSALHKHMRNEHPEDGPARFTFPVPLQLIHESGQSRRYLYVCNQDLDPIPPPAMDSGHHWDDTVKAKVDAFLKKDQDALAAANLLKPGIQPTSHSGHIGPWAKQLGWHMYWAGKPVAAIGSLGTNPSKWPGAHADFAGWLLTAAQHAAHLWMTTLLSAGRQVQQTFRAYGPEPSQPYSLSTATVKKRADTWALLLALLVHAFFDGDTLGYFGNSTQEDHLHLDDNLQEILLQLRELYNTADPDTDMDQDPALTTQVHSLLLCLSYGLLTQAPQDYGQTEQLTLVKMFLHLCVGRHGVPKLVSAATSLLASLDFCLRAILHHFLLSSDDGMLLDWQPAAIHAEVDAQLQRYLWHNSNAASAHLQSLLRFGLVLAQDESSSFAFCWSKDQSKVTFGTEIIAIDRLQALLHGAQQQAERLLRQLCLLAPDASLELHLGNLTDDHRNTQPGFSMAAAIPATTSTVLCRAVAGNGALAHPLVDPLSEEAEFDVAAVHVYFDMHNEFTKLLAVLIELSSGLPARGTELLQLQHTNTLLGPRNLFLHDGCIFTALPSNKGTGRQKVIPRFLPHAVGCLVVWYVTQVVPFIHLLHNTVVQPREACSLLLVDHTGKPYNTNTVSKTLQVLCQQYVSSLSAGLTLRTWRQLAVSIDRKLIRPKPLTLDDLEESAHDLQAGHSTSTAEQHYGLDASMLNQLTQESMDAMMAVSERWHIFWSMQSHSGEEVKPFSSLCYSGGSTNTSHMLEAIKRKQDAMEEDLRCIRRKLELPSLPAAPAAVTAVAAGIPRSAALPTPVSAALVKVTGSHCTKTLEQAYALNAIHAKETPLTIVMATGSGKSVLFMAPLHWLPPASVVVVVVPFIALTEDLLEQCQHKGISASKWTGYQSASKVEGSQLVFVAAEHCYSQPFALWAQALDQQKRLAALFFDECHVCLTQKDFRPAMDKIKALTAAVHVPQYYLTATLPPALVPAFKKALHLPQDGMGMIRAATNRKNISYAVQQVASTSELLFGLKHALVHHPRGAVMVFCKTKSAAQATAEEIGCCCIVSDMEEKDKQSSMAAWLQCSEIEQDNHKRVLVGTTAIGTGINPQHVQLVLHYGDTWDLVSYVQESGRAGRSGAPATALLVTLQHGQRSTEVQQYVEEQVCRRLAISTYMDGMPITCCSQPDFALCDLCQQQVEAPHTPAKRAVALQSSPPSSRQEHQHHSSNSSDSGDSSSSTTTATSSSSRPAPQQHQCQQGSATLASTSLLQGLPPGCTLCYLFRNRHTCSAPHGFHNCNCWDQIEPLLPLSLEGRINSGYIGKLKRNIKDKAKNIACWSCLVPIRLCSNNSASPMCQCSRRYADVVLPAVAAVLRSREHCMEVYRQLGIEFHGVVATRDDLGKEVKYGGEPVMLAFAIFATAIAATM